MLGDRVDGGFRDAALIEDAVLERCWEAVLIGAILRCFSGVMGVF